MRAMASQITNLTIAYSTVYSGTDQRKIQSSASLAFVRGIHRWPVNSPHKGPVSRKIFPFDDVIMGQDMAFGSDGGVAYSLLWCELTTSVDFPYLSRCKAAESRLEKHTW